MKLISWNVNGLRSVSRKGFHDWFKKESADLVCLQEIKISEHQVKEDKTIENPEGYYCAWHFAEKPGYSGLAVYSKKEPSEIRKGLNQAEFDTEARWLELDFGSLTLINSYFPNSQRDHSRLGYKLSFCAAAEKRLLELERKGRNVVLCGDFNIAHKEIDLKNPKTNKDNAGFLPEERAWMDQMIEKNGWIDTFRHFEKGPGHYTWWSYRPGVRAKNIGWRLDYFIVNKEFKSRLRSVEHLTTVMGSDHCPIRLNLRD